MPHSSIIHRALVAFLLCSSVMSVQAQSVNIVVRSDVPSTLENKPHLQGDAFFRDRFERAIDRGGRGCAEEIDWQDKASSKLGFCRVRLEQDVPRDDLNVIKHGVSLDITLVEGDVRNSVTATCSHGEWHIAKAICHYSKHQESNTGDGFNGVQTRYNAEYEDLDKRFKEATGFNKK